MKKIIIIFAIVLIVFVGVVVFVNTKKQSGDYESQNIEAVNQSAPTDRSGTSATEEVKTYTLTDVGAHAVEGDCWTVTRGKVFDISSFTSKHPGGPGILKGCGKDSTEMFEKRANGTPHPEKAWEALQTYLIGDLK
ncbi:MAG: cytochrome b5-like heme/steroid binding domain-containing protein [Patescibacteria group bacterium]